MEWFSRILLSRIDNSGDLLGTASVGMKTRREREGERREREREREKRKRERERESRCCKNDLEQLSLHSCTDTPLQGYFGRGGSDSRAIALQTVV